MTCFYEAFRGYNMPAGAPTPSNPCFIRYSHVFFMLMPNRISEYVIFVSTYNCDNHRFTELKKYVGKLGLNRFNHTSWVAIVILTDRPKSACNRCVIEIFGGVLVLSRCFLDFSVGVGAFVIGLSQISSFFSCSQQ